MGRFDDLAAQFDPASTKRRGDEFEAVCKWFLENDPTYQPLLRRVWLWNDWPGRRGADSGIDLVAEEHDGKLWAIQAKAYDPRYSISKRDVDKFVAESSRNTFTHRLLIGTTDKRHHIAVRLMDDLGIPFLGLTQLREADDYLDWPATPAALRPAKPPKAKKPHDYQQQAIKDVVKGFTIADRGQLIMACGTGKTLTAWFIREKLAAERTLVLVPSLSLLKQTMREWQTANPKKSFATLPVCSDETVGDRGEDAAVSHTSDLGVPVTTDPELIAEFLRKLSGPRVVFCTYQSSPQIAAAFALGRVPAFDLVIADEAHRVAGPAASDFGTVLDDEAIKAKRRLFMTATPRYFTGRVLREAKDSDYEIASMDDHAKFGEEFHRLTFSQAIDIDRLTDYQVAIIGVDDATYREWAERGALVTVDGKKITDARSLAGQIGLAKAMRKFDLRRVISFHSRVKASKDFAASMPAVLDWMPARQRPKGTLWSSYASGEMSAGERAVLIQHLTRLDDGERGLLANARCLAEGVDVPALDAVAFIDPRRSEVDIVQAVGRAIRKSDDKTVGTIVIPVFIDTDQDAELALDSSAFKPVWDVIKALRAHDTELGEQLDALRREMGRKGGKPRLPGKIHVDVPATVGTDFIDSFDVRLVERTTSSWDFWFGLLENYVRETGHCQVPLRAQYRGFRLGAWVRNQRDRQSKGRLSSSQMELLANLSGWTWSVLDDQWDVGYQELRKFAEAECHAMVPQRYSIDGFALGAWVNTQRKNHDKGSLVDRRRELLESVPGWWWDPKEAAWEQGWAILMRYVEINGHPRPPHDVVVDGFPLGTWVARQRDAFKKQTISDVRRARLEALPGWSWDPLTEQWERGYEALRGFVAQFGHARVPATFTTPDGYRIGGWVSKRRNARAAGELEADRIQRLEKLPGWTWDPHGDLWEQGFTHLAQFVQEFQNARVERKVEFNGFPLGQWVHVQRHKYQHGKLAADLTARLEALPGWTWDPYSDDWNEALAKLVDFAAKSGNCNVPRQYQVDGFGLGHWVRRQRLYYRAGKLPHERTNALAMVPGWYW